MDSPTGAREALLTAALEELTEHGAGAVGLRAVARRAGLSHAAPGYLFGDRAGMLTALAIRGFDGLSCALERVPEPPGPSRRSALGNVYLDYGLENGPLFDLMFSAEAARSRDVGLDVAKRRALAPLVAARGDEEGSEQDALMSWGLVHGLVTLVRQGALPFRAGDMTEVRSLIDRFASLVG